MLDLPAEWLAMVRALLARHVPQAEVWAYGSRVQGDAHGGSDLDLVVRNRSDLNRPTQLDDLRAAFSDSNIPILVDVLDWALIPQSFRDEIVRGGKVPIFNDDHTDQQ